MTEIETETSEPGPGIPLAYRNADARPVVWVWAVLCLTGLGLIALGGCFLVGLLIMVSGTPNVPPALGQGPVRGSVIFVFAFIALAGLACFGGAAFVLVRTIRVLLAHSADSPQ